MSAIFGFKGKKRESTWRTLADCHTIRGPLIKSHAYDDNSALGICSHRQDQWLCLKAPSLSKHNKASILICGEIYNCAEIEWDLWLTTFFDRPTEGLKDLNGAFILAGHDPDGNLILARDAIGERTAFYAERDGLFVFGSSLRALTRVLPSGDNLDRIALAQYLSYSFVPAERTLVEGVYELLPGQMILVDQNVTCRKHNYYTLEKNDVISDITDSEARAQFTILLNNAIEERRGNDKKLGLYLSGGLDSSLVASYLNDSKPRDASISSFAIHYGNKYENELEYAKEVADRLKFDHHEVELRPSEVARNFKEMSQVLDQPIGDPVTIGNFFLGKHASGQVDCIFNGEGGDPCFGGPKNMPMLLNHWYFPHEINSYKREFWYLWSYDRCFGELSNLLNGYNEDKMFSLVSAPVAHYLSPDREGSLLKKMLLANIALKGGHLILPKVEQITSYFGIRVCSPLFDKRLVEFALMLPDSLLLKNGVDKIILRQIAKNRIPDSVIRREKSGMKVPVHFWFQGRMRRSAKKLLLSRSNGKNSLFNAKRIKELVNYDTGQLRSRHGLKIWMLYNFELWKDRCCV